LTLQEVSEKIQNHESLFNDLHYFSFVFRIGKMLVSNFMETNVDGNIDSDLTLESLTDVAERFDNEFHGDAENIVKVIDRFVDGADKHTPYDSDKIPEIVRKQMEKDIRQYMNTKSLPTAGLPTAGLPDEQDKQDENRELLISMSHIDQGIRDYHIHRLFKR
jgi:hypothetical protein